MSSLNTDVSSLVCGGVQLRTAAFINKTMDSKAKAAFCSSFLDRALLRLFKAFWQYEPVLEVSIAVPGWTEISIKVT